jgi:hypothetical protein
MDESEIEELGEKTPDCSPPSTDVENDLRLSERELDGKKEEDVQERMIKINCK